jgi:hypothetical protein
MLRACYHIHIGKGAIGDRLRGSPHLQRIVARVTEAGPRPVAELLIEAMEQANAGADPAALDRLLQRWARLDPATVRAVGGDRFPKPPLDVVPARARGR